jgi:hypothetical protein
MNVNEYEKKFFKKKSFIIDLLVIIHFMEFSNIVYNLQ